MTIIMSKIFLMNFFLREITNSFNNYYYEHNINCSYFAEKTCVILKIIISIKTIMNNYHNYHNEHTWITIIIRIPVVILSWYLKVVLKIWQYLNSNNINKTNKKNT